MGAGYYTGEPCGDPADVPCDPDAWSEDSKRSVADLSTPRPYRDRAYLCWRCRGPDVFTAVDQKRAFEVRKVNISQQRILCEACHREWIEMEREARECRRRWADERPALRHDTAFLRRWLVVPEALPGYNGVRDEANMAMLRRLLGRSRLG